MSAHRCNCGQPAPNATICPRCVHRLERDLAEIPSLVDQLDITLSRQSAATLHDGGKSAETALPYNGRASEARVRLHGALVGGVRVVHIEGERFPADLTADLSRWLLARLEDIRVHAAADQVHDEISFAVSAARKVVDRPRNRSRVFVAACLDPSCVGELYAHFPTADYDSADPSTHASMTCTECDVAYPAEEWLRVGARLLRRSA